MPGSGGTGESFTGEDRVFIIPVGAPVTIGTGGNQRKISFTQIAVKNILRLQLDKNGNILSVEVVQ